MTDDQQTWRGIKSKKQMTDNQRTHETGETGKKREGGNDDIYRPKSYGSWKTQTSDRKQFNNRPSNRGDNRWQETRQRNDRPNRRQQGQGQGQGQVRGKNDRKPQQGRNLNYSSQRESKPQKPTPSEFPSLPPRTTTTQIKHEIQTEQKDQTIVDQRKKNWLDVIKEKKEEQDKDVQQVTTNKKHELINLERELDPSSVGVVIDHSKHNKYLKSINYPQKHIKTPKGVNTPPDSDEELSDDEYWDSKYKDELSELHDEDDED